MKSLLQETLRDVEFVIFGGGPAGLSAADMLVQNERKVVIIDRGKSFKTYYSATGKYDLIKDMEVGGIGGATQKWGGQLVRLGTPEYSNWLEFEGFERNYIEALEFETDQVLEKFALHIPKNRKLGPEADWTVVIRQSFIPKEINLENVFKTTLESPFFHYVEGVELISLENIREKVHMKLNDGSTYDLSEKHILLGMGSIENTSILAKSLPNFSKVSHPQLGKNLQDHPHGVLFEVQAPLLTWYRRYFYFGLSRRGTKTKFEVNSTVGNRLRGGVAEIHPLDSSVTFQEELRAAIVARSALLFFKLVLRVISVFTVKFLGKRVLLDSAQIWFQYEQCLNADSHLVINPDDLEYNWTNSQSDLEFVNAASSTLQKYFYEHGFRVSKIKQFANIQELNEWGNEACHPSGTVPIGSDQRNSVADYLGRVHSIPKTNLLGASLFPTSGWFNPTLLIMAYSRLVVKRILRD